MIEKIGKQENLPENMGIISILKMKKNFFFVFRYSTVGPQLHNDNLNIFNFKTYIFLSLKHNIFFLCHVTRSKYQRCGSRFLSKPNTKSCCVPDFDASKSA